MKRCAMMILVLAACGGKSAGGGTGPSNAGGDAAAKLSWEAALKPGATFTLKADMEGEEGRDDLVIKVTNVEDLGTERVYSLDWEGGPQQLIVRGEQVIIGGAQAEDMQDPWEMPGGIKCYAEDFSNPDGCEDVCDASLCFDDTGIVAASGLYTPDYLPFVAK